MISEEQFKAATTAKNEAEETINAYFKQKAEAFNRRLIENPVFTDDELYYSATSLCPCGHGLAYPKGCGAWHYWDCSAILKGIADKSVKHTDRLPFSIYGVKGESEYRGTTRGVFIPQIKP